MNDPTETQRGGDSPAASGAVGRSSSPVAAVIDAYHDPEPDRRGMRPGEDADTAFERRLGSLVGWGIDHDVAFDRAWTIRTDRLDFDVMAEFVYLAPRED